MPGEAGRDGMRALVEDPEKVLLDTFPSQYQSTLVLPVLDLLSSHSPGEEYMGAHAEPAWLAEGKIKSAFEKFKGSMIRIVGEIDGWNEDPNRKNRYGAGVAPYVLLKPSYGDPKDKKTVMEMGIPNSISI
uniref:LOX10 n=1 Tax=Arundo donax TaxID=35708 RepID=A0A0A8Z3A2_ARUDO